MISVCVDFSVNDVVENTVVAFLQRIEPIHLANATPWRLELTGSYYGPTAAVVIAAASLSAVSAHVSFDLLLPQEPPSLHAFMRFSGLAQLATTRRVTPSAADEHPLNETSPLQQFHKMNWAGGTPLVRLIRRHLPDLGAESEEILRVCYSEIVQNIEDHAESSIGGVICARFFANLHEIRIAVVDRGIGIPGTLRNAGLKIDSDAHALRQVLEGNVTSKSRPNNMGQGISNLALIAKGNGGRLLIFSGDAHAVVDSKGSRVRAAKCRFPGTLVLLSLPVASGPPDVDE